MDRQFFHALCKIKDPSFLRSPRPSILSSFSSVQHHPENRLGSPQKLPITPETQPLVSPSPLRASLASSGNKDVAVDACVSRETANCGQSVGAVPAFPVNDLPLLPISLVEFVRTELMRQEESNAKSVAIVGQESADTRPSVVVPDDLVLLHAAENESCDGRNEESMSWSRSVEPVVDGGEKAVCWNRPAEVEEVHFSPTKVKQLWDSSADVKKAVVLRDWTVVFARKTGSVYVQGIRDTIGDFWRSTSIVDCIDRRQVKTKRGSLYVLKGPVDQSEMLEQGFSTASISAFRHGFPRNWKKLIREHAKQLKSKHGENTKGKSQPVCDAVTPKSSRPHDVYEPKKHRKHAISRLPGKQASTIDDSGESTQTRTASGRCVRPVMNFWCNERCVLDNKGRTLVYNGSPNFLDFNNFKSPKNIKVATSVLSRLHQYSSQSQQSDSTSEEEANTNVKPVVAVSLMPISTLSTASSSTPTQVACKPDGLVSIERGLPRYQTRSGCTFKGDNRKLNVEENKGIHVKNVKQPKGRKRKEQDCQNEKDSDTTRKSPKKSQTLTDSLKEEQQCDRSSDIKHTSSNEAVVETTRMSIKCLSVDANDDNTKEKAAEKVGRAKCGRKHVQFSFDVVKDKAQEKQVTRPLSQQDDDDSSDDEWSDTEIQRLNRAVFRLPPGTAQFWSKVSKYVESRTEHECQQKYHGANSRRRMVKQRKSKSTHEEDTKQLAKAASTGQVIKLAGVGTLKRRRQLQALLEQEKETQSELDLFDNTPFRNRMKRRQNTVDSAVQLT
ncbi:mis18-binding protein 1-like isoform X2 [Corticium candelabrum]|uniref:mis18-binding protein 1-like isoform X2 n=1 Tax=Corticium candelabrum TaxID=121492 RepID=UPI002E263763|nr:mis18-binding protein 1-like isoform X2 [Corticium candelabrum]